MYSLGLQGRNKDEGEEFTRLASFSPSQAVESVFSVWCNKTKVISNSRQCFLWTFCVTSKILLLVSSFPFLTPTSVPFPILPANFLPLHRKNIAFSLSYSRLSAKASMQWRTFSMGFRFCCQVDFHIQGIWLGLGVYNWYTSRKMFRKIKSRWSSLEAQKNKLTIKRRKYYQYM